MNLRDYAIVIGISDYLVLGNISGPTEQATAIAGWLTDASGGGLPAENVAVLTSHQTADDGRMLYPILDDVQKAIERALFFKPTTQGRVGRRLYLYLAGRGFQTERHEPALLMADAKKEMPEYAIDGRAYADFFLNSGRFDEVVLFVDCQWSSILGYASQPLWAEWGLPNRPDSGTRFFYVWTSPAPQARKVAVSKSSRATSRGDSAQGALTRALLEGLRSGATYSDYSDGRVTSQTLGDYLPLLFRKLANDEYRLELISNGEIVFDSGSEEVAQEGAAEEQAPPGEAPADKSSAPPPKPPGVERVVAQSDDPATVDELFRRPFAEVIAARMEEVWTAQSAKPTAGHAAPAGAFMIHLHGPWGAGKTSVLNFLRENLQDERRPLATRWVVIDFNAWRNQRIRPPWWTLIKEVYTQAARQLGPARSLWLRAQWLVWRARADWFPVLLTVLLIALVVLLATGVIQLGLPPPPAADTVTAGGARGAPGQTVEQGFKILAGVIAAAAALFAFTRSLVFGSARAAQTYTELRSDPLGPIVRLFQKLVKLIRRPVAVFVDDLDRCDSPYVIELLEGIQTLFRNAPLTYVVAADRKWICSSFEKSFADFGKTIGEPGRPLGYLFLDKVFQVSTSIPRLSPEVQMAYWKGLLRVAAAADPEALEKELKQAERDALQVVKDIHTQEALEEKIAEVSGDPVKEPAMRAAAAKQITSTEAQRQTEHRLQRFANLVEPNPRGMKRLVNAYGLHQATHFLEHRQVSPEALARWTIIELRWPLLADLLAARPQLIADLANGQAPANKLAPANLKKLFGDAEVKSVIGGDGASEIVGLDEAAIREIVGSGQAIAPPGPAAADETPGTAPSS
jgi:KAP family P-loop domain